LGAPGRPPRPSFGWCPRSSPSANPRTGCCASPENLVYTAAGILLVLGAVIVLGAVGYHLVRDLGHGAEKSVTVALDGLLLVFIVLELLAGVRATMTEKKLVSEPFLVVGIIASIKEIVVLTLQSKESTESSGPAFRNAMTEIGVLAGVILLLAIGNYLVRRKEREPHEEDETGEE